MASFIGYHGTSEKNANNIKRTTFHIKNDVISWLGSGIYFFEDNQELAEYWAKQRYPSDKTSILLCLIEVPDNNVLDLTDPQSEQSKLFHANRIALIESLKGKLDVMVKNREDFDAKTLNHICSKFKYLIIRAATYTYSRIDREYRLKSKIPNGVELCLKNNVCIEEKKLFKGEDNG